MIVNTDHRYISQLERTSLNAAFIRPLRCSVSFRSSRTELSGSVWIPFSYMFRERLMPLEDDENDCILHSNYRIDVSLLNITMEMTEDELARHLACHHLLFG